MKCFKLNVLAFVPKQIHHGLEVVLIGDVSSHNGEIGPIQQNFA